MLRLLGLRRHVVGAEHVPTTGGAVLAVSHFSYLDFVLAGWVAWHRGHRLVRFLATAASFRHPVAGPLMRAMQHVPVERDGGGGAYRTAVARLRAGELVGVFPESRVTRSFTLLPLKAGAARMAGQAGVPLVPVGVWGTHRGMTRTHRTPLGRALGTPVEVRIGAPLHPGPDDDPVEVTARLAEAMTALLDDAQAGYPVPAPAGAWWQPAHLGGGAPTPEQALLLDADDPVVRAQARLDAARTPIPPQDPRTTDEREATP
ncbi:MAG: 1-acyl-sn-glycerol-3-phosphate acyltransferase [Actinobacteria bacterium]|nr:1-acyl-sn-glycerol-3-phosphate acyltransferase [Actinomycetota bacterium]